MSNMLKCPNPSCPYAFDPSQVPTGVVLSCPRCAMQFTLGAPATAAPPVGRTASGLPMFPPQTPAVNSELEDVGRSATEERDPDAPRPGRHTSKTQLFILAAVAAVMMAGTVLAIVFKLTGKKGDSQNDSALKDKDRNISIGKMPKGWAQDTTLSVKYGSPFAYGFKRESPEGYVIFGSAVYDGGQREPRMSEMRDDLMKPLTKMFDMSTLTMEPPLATEFVGAKITPNLGFKFRAQSSDALIWQGEAYAVFHRGIAYFWVSWCGENEFENLKSEFAEFRAQFQLLEQRADWKPKKPNAVDYKGAVFKYTFTDAEDIWQDEPLPDPKVEGLDIPKQMGLDRWLRINHTRRGDRKAIPEEADLRVYLIPGGGDPLSQGKEFIQNLWIERLKRDNAELPAPTFEELTGEQQGDPVDAPLGSAPFVRYQSRVLEGKKVIASSESRLIVVSAIKLDDQIVVMQCWCELSKRNVFEARFVHIASTLR